MKKFTGLGVIFLALVLGLYYAMGYFTENKVRESLNIINQTNGLTANLSQYKRGWFSSEALIDWQLRVPERVMQASGNQLQTIAAKNYQLQIPFTIYHGPVIFSDRGIKFGFGYAHTSLPLPDEYRQRFNDLFAPSSSEPKLEMSFFVNYLNRSKLHVAVPAFKLIAKQGSAQFEWLGMKTTTHISSSRDQVSGNIFLEGFRLSRENLITAMSNVTSHYKLYKTTAGLYTGKASLSFPAFSVTHKGEKLLELDEFAVQSDTDIDAGLFSSSFQSSIDKIIFNNQTYGPGNLQAAVRNLDANALERINVQANQIQHGPGLESQKAMLAIIPELPKLFSKGAEFEVSKMTFVMPQGEIAGNMLISLPKEEVVNPFQLVQKIQGTGKLKVPVQVFHELLSESIKHKLVLQHKPQPLPSPTSPQPATPAAQNLGSTTDISQQAISIADKQLTGMVNSGLLIQQGSDYLIEVKLSQGQLLVNDKPFNSAMMAF